MSKKLNLVGKRFGRLVVEHLYDSKHDHGEQWWLCRCDCGEKAIVSTGKLRSGHTKSCGCMQRELMGCSYAGKTARTKHGMYGTPTYHSWMAMKNRCTNKNVRNFKNYGGRGITVCSRWTGEHGFENFLSDMGKRPEGTSIDRINVNGNYEPSNCRWATQKQQMNNTRSNHIITFNDKSMTVQQWADCTGIPEQTLSGRIKRGWSIEDALIKKVRA